MPVKADRFAEALRMGSEVFHALKSQLHDAGHNTNVGDEGGFAPNLASADEALGFIMKSIEQAGYKPGEDIMLALDPASTEFFKKGKYELEGEKKSLDAAAWSSTTRPGEALPDRLDRGRHGRGRHGRLEAITDKLGKKIQLVGDDLFVTNPKRLAQGIKDGLANAILVQGQPDRHAHRDDGSRVDGASCLVRRSDVASLGRDRGLDHRRSGRRHQLRADQDRLAVAFGSARQVQSTPAYRRATRPQARYAGTSILRGR